MNIEALYKRFCKILISFFLMHSLVIWADVSVVVHPKNHAKISKKDIYRIYLGKEKTFSNGTKAIPIDLSEAQDIRDTFNKNILEKSQIQLDAHWARLIFTGRGQRPEQYGTDEVKKLVSDNIDYIGFIESSMVDSSVKEVLRIKEN